MKETVEHLCIALKCIINVLNLIHLFVQYISVRTLSSPVNQFVSTYYVNVNGAMVNSNSARHYAVYASIMNGQSTNRVGVCGFVAMH